MKYKPWKQHRLQNFDYASNAAYFVTICTKDRKYFFGKVDGDLDNPSIELSEMGKIAKEFWAGIPKYFPDIILDEWVVMPNHLHGIIVIQNDDMNSVQNFELPRKFGPLQKRSLSSIINQFKGSVTRACRENNLDFAWQQGFFDRVVRNEEELNRIRVYISNNPRVWILKEDELA